MRTADGIELVVHELGGSGAPLVFAHATGLHGLVWKPVAEALARCYRCVSFDARGHGDSAPAPRDDYSWPAMARDALAVVECLGLNRPWGIGHSAGATTLLLAEEAHPGTFAGLYCFEPVVVPVDPPLGPDPANWLAAVARRRQDTFPSRAHAYHHYASKPPLQALAPPALWWYVEHGFEDLPEGGVRLKCRPEHEALVHEMATAHDGFARLGEVCCPVVIAGGSASEAFSPIWAGPLVAALADVDVEVLPGLGHLGPLEDPAGVARSIERVLSHRGEG